MAQYETLLQLKIMANGKNLASGKSLKQLFSYALMESLHSRGLRRGSMVIQLSTLYTLLMK